MDADQPPPYTSVVQPAPTDAEARLGSLARENETLRQALADAIRSRDTLEASMLKTQKSLEREIELLRSHIRPAKPVFVPPGLDEVTRVFTAKLNSVCQSIRSDFSCDGKITVRVDEGEPPGSYFIADFRKTTKACWEREVFHYTEVVDTILFPLLKDECKPWHVFFALGGYLCIDTNPEKKK